MKKKYDPDFDNRSVSEIYEKKNKNNKAILLVFMFSVFCLGFPQYLTQYTASEFNYHPALGEPIIAHWYSPFKCLDWLPIYNNYPEVINRALGYGFAIFSPIMIIVALMIFSKKKKLKGNQFLHGSARWATKEEIVQSGLIAREPTFKEKLISSICSTFYNLSLSIIQPIDKYFDKQKELYSAVKSEYQGKEQLYKAAIDGYNQSVEQYNLNKKKYDAEIEKLLQENLKLVDDQETLNKNLKAIDEFNQRIKSECPKKPNLESYDFVSNKEKSIALKTKIDRLSKLVKPLHAIPNLFKKRILKKKTQEGVFLGGYRDDKGKLYYMQDNGPTHVLVVAPTRSGKGVGLVNNTMVTWRESAIVNDIKGELRAFTSGWRKYVAHNKIILFEPAKERINLNADYEVDERGIKLRDEHGNYICHPKKDKNGNDLPPLYPTARWNPFDEIRSEGSIELYWDKYEECTKERICDGSHEVSDTQNICGVIVDPKGKGIVELDHWGKTAYALMQGLVMHLKHNIPEMCNLRILNMVMAGNVDFKALRELRKNKGPNYKITEEDFQKCDMKTVYEDMRNGLDLNGRLHRVSKAISAIGSEQYNRPDEEAGSVLSTAKSFLSLYVDEIVAANSSTSDFKIKQIMNSKDPVTVYMITNPNDQSRLSPLYSVFINTCLLLMTDKEDNTNWDFGGKKDYAHRCLMMLDEFTSLGSIPLMQKSLAYVGGYGLKCYLIVQDLAQLYAQYGKDESITSNCHNTVWYAPNKEETASALSKLCGTTTILKESISYSGSGLKQSESRSMQETSRPLLTPDEAKTLPKTKNDPITGKVIDYGAEIVTSAGMQPILGVKSLFYLDPKLLKRTKCPIVPYTDIIYNANKDEDHNSTNAFTDLLKDDIEHSQELEKNRSNCAQGQYNESSTNTQNQTLSKDEKSNQELDNSKKNIDNTNKPKEDYAITESEQKILNEFNQITQQEQEQDNESK